MKRNKLNFEEISQSMELLDRDSQRGVKGGDAPSDDCVEHNIVLPEVVVFDTPINKSFTYVTFWSRSSGFGSSYDNYNQGGFGSASYFGGGGGGGSAQGVWGVLNSPVGDATISSEFNSHRNCSGCSQTHGGTDYAVPINTAVMATASGTVARAYLSSTYGNVVIVNHGPSANGSGNVYTLYGHGNILNVSQGQSVNTGDLIMNSGNTGRSTGPHLHYEVIVTPFTPFEAGFFRNLDIRYGPGELEYFLGQ